MKAINTVFLILFVSLAASPLFAQSDLSIGSLKTESEINTFVQKVEGAGDLAATVQAADGGYVTTSRIDNTSFLVRKIKLSGQKQWERRLTSLIQSIISLLSMELLKQRMVDLSLLAGRALTSVLKA
jgi:hypothetical protein